MSRSNDPTLQQEELEKSQKLGLSSELSELHPLVIRQTARDVWVFLLIFRCSNALLVRTFFQPDEYFQSLEPAWQIAFGANSGAWITWEWHYKLRSSLHPAIFAAVYYISDTIMTLTRCFPQTRAKILTQVPKLVQAYFAATGDFYTWQLSEKVYGTQSFTAWATLLMSVLSPWNWFCSTRTFSNCLEMTLTIMALYFWPWSLSSSTKLHQSSNEISDDGDRSEPRDILGLGSKKKLRSSLVLAGAASILRPTNLLIWLPLLAPQVTALLTRSSRLLPRQIYLVLFFEGLLCSTIVLSISALSDRLYYGSWTFPPYQWLHFNLSQDLAVFYGRNDWHFYFTQGLPQLLTIYFPFALVSGWQALALPSGDVRFALITIIMVTLGILSLISHKEVRFTYTLLPLLHVLTAPQILNFFTIIKSQNVKKATKTFGLMTRAPQFPTLRRKGLLVALLAFNSIIAYYVTTVHQSGVLAVMPYLRTLYESQHLTEASVPPSTSTITPNIYLAFLMPCHSTPFRSELVHPNLTAWALTCSPPLHIPPHTEDRASYRDEADQFFDDPVGFLTRELGVNTARQWPKYIVGFQGIDQVIKKVWDSRGGPGAKVIEVKRVFNSHWHDDWRRRGDVIVWQLIPGQN